MKYKPDDPFTPINLPAIDGTLFDSKDLMGKRFLLSFYRFASCPFCNLRVHELATRFNEFGKQFTVVAIFDSSLENLQKHALEHQAPFPILADEANFYYKQYGIQQSVSGLLISMITRMPELIKAMLNGYIPWPVKGHITKMPADFLINENGIIQHAYYGKDSGDHLDFETIRLFALKNNGADHV